MAGVLTEVKRDFFQDTTERSPEAGPSEVMELGAKHLAGLLSGLKASEPTGFPTKGLIRMESPLSPAASSPSDLFPLAS